MQISDREQLLLTAALHRDEAVALASWHEWQGSITLEEAPYPEARLLPAVYARLSRMKAPPVLPEKLRGSARATFTQNMLHARECLPALRDLAAECRVMALKGLAHCARYGTWSSRPMGDVDVLIELRSLERACRHLAERGWQPKYGMTWTTLVHRSALKRDSWGLTRDRADVDLHWRVMEAEDEGELERIVWETAQTVEVLGRRIAIPSSEVALISCINHGFRSGSHGDTLQAIVDAHALLKDCNPDSTAMLVDRFGLADEFLSLLEALSRLGAATKGHDRRVEGRSTPPQRRRLATRLPWQIDLLLQRRASRVPRARFEGSLLTHPRAYRAWEAVGRPKLLEPLFLRVAGPVTRPLKGCAKPRNHYYPNACEVMDEVGGIGWSWPDTNRDCVWSDRADARLLLPVRRGADHLLVASFSERRVLSSAPNFDVFVNGRRLARIDFRDHPDVASYVVQVPKRIIFSDWVEVSFRPLDYTSQDVAVSSYASRLSVPLQRLGVVRLDELAGKFFDENPIPTLYEHILKEEEPYFSKFQNIREKIASSPFSGSADLPDGFDPIRYVLYYYDLLMAEVDPFEHYLRWGRSEGRVWR